MAFHGRSRSASRGRRESGRESILGLAGWLFADLLLALSVVFLVAQDRVKSDKEMELEEVLEERNKLQEEKELLQRRLDELLKVCNETSKVCSKNSGLIPTEFLRIEIPGGAERGLSASEMAARIRQVKPIVFGISGEVRRTTWAALSSQNRKVGLMIFFARDDQAVKTQGFRNLGLIVRALVSQGLIDEKQQLESKNGKYEYDLFPTYPFVFTDFGLRGSDLQITAFMLEIDSSVLTPSSGGGK